MHGNILAKARFIKLLGALLFCAALSACGPVYDTQYTFLPPEDSTGRACVFQCDNSKLQCQQLQDQSAELCESRAEREYDRCVDKYGEKKCYRDYCSSSDHERCETQYRSCYQSCGGNVRSETVCVAFCDGAPSKK